MTCHPGALNHLDTPSSQLRGSTTPNRNVVRARLGRAAQAHSSKKNSTHSVLRDARRCKSASQSVEPQPLLHPDDESSVCDWLAAQLKAHDHKGSRARTCGVRRAACAAAPAATWGRGAGRCSCYCGVRRGRWSALRFTRNHLNVSGSPLTI
jgi:hypothetical protein